MGRECGNCKMARDHGWTIVYCTFFGIDIRRTYDR